MTVQCARTKPTVLDLELLWRVCALMLQVRDHHKKGCQLLQEERQFSKFMEVIC